MKRSVLAIAFLTVLLFPSVVICEETPDWSTAPIITKAYELESGKIYLEWQGKAPVYQVYMDGKSLTSVIVNNAIIPITKGTHSVTVYPINETKNADTTLRLEIQGDGKVLGRLGGSIDIDLGALGLDPKKLTAGQPSKALHIDYSPNPIFDSTPIIQEAFTDSKDRVCLLFEDRQNAEEYLITVKYGNDVNYVRFNTGDENAASFISKTNSMVTLTLDPEYLRAHECMVPELDRKFSFAVQFRKHPIDIVTEEKDPTVFHESRISRFFDYTPTAFWKSAPVVTFASQVADGEILLTWNHDDGGVACEYSVVRIEKKLGIKTGETVLGVTAANEYTVGDLMNGTYIFTVVPQHQGEKGFVSDEVRVDIKNDWVVAPLLSCVQTDRGTVRITWTSSPNVELYHIIVYTGDNASVLRFVNLDYKKYTETFVPSNNGETEYIFFYDGDYDADIGLRIKIEVFGIRHAADGSEQKSGTSSQLITIY